VFLLFPEASQDEPLHMILSILLNLCDEGSLDLQHLNCEIMKDADSFVEHAAET
jgi:hypothetical protein